MGPCHHGMLRPQVADGERPPIWRVAANILDKHAGQPTRGGTPTWGLGEVPTTPHRKNWHSHKTHTRVTGLD